MSDDFLARENEALGGQFSSFTSGGDADIDFDRAASAFPDLDNFDGDIPQPTPARHAQMSTLESFAFDEPSKPAVKVTGDDEIEKFESSFPDIGGEAFTSPPLSSVPSFLPQGFVSPQQQAMKQYSAPVYQPPEEDPEVIKEWRERQAEQIRKRDADSAERRKATVEKAERSIDQFYEEYNAKKEKNIKANKENEKAFLESQTDSLSQGTTWGRICDTIDLQNSQSKTLARTGPNTTDLTRFKEVLLRLKREGDAAPGAAGY